MAKVGHVPMKRGERILWGFVAFVFGLTFLGIILKAFGYWRGF